MFRRSIRLKEYDYHIPGGYFVTICVRNAEELLGEILDDEMILNSYGQVVHEEWRRIEMKRDSVLLDVYQIMPNHFHGIIFLLNELEQVDPVGIRAMEASSQPNLGSVKSRAKGPDPGSLGAVIGGYKSAVTRRINLMRGESGAPLWQRNYWERIIRNERELEAIRKYILTNPAKWEKDDLHPGSARLRKWWR